MTFIFIFIYIYFSFFALSKVNPNQRCAELSVSQPVTCLTNLDLVQMVPPSVRKHNVVPWLEELMCQLTGGEALYILAAPLCTKEGTSELAIWFRQVVTD